MAVPVQIVIDCADPDRLATFWATALGYKKQDPPDGFESWQAFLAAQGIPEDQWNSASAVVDPDGAGPRIFFQRVPEPKASKNRCKVALDWPCPAHTRRPESWSTTQVKNNRPRR